MSTVTIDNVTYTLNSAHSTASAAKKDSNITSATILDSVRYDGTVYTVITIGNNAFQNCSVLTGVTIGSNVTSIGNSAFEFCSKLSGVTIGANVQTIGYNAFKDCSALTGVTIPDVVTSIAVGVFNSCITLTGVTIGANVTSIGYAAFIGCTELTAVTIPDAVTSIGDSAFQQCTKLTGVTIGSGLTTMDGSAFSYCGDTLTSMYFLGDYPSGINGSTFYGTGSLTLYYLDGATSWSSYDSMTIGIPAYPIPTITSATTSSVSISADTGLSPVYIYTSTDSGVTWTTNSVTMTNGSGTLSGLSSGTLVSTIANVYDATTYADYCKTVTIPTPTSNVCFPAKTPIMTNQGPINIEDIDPSVHTIRNKKIVAITKTVAHDKNLVRIAKHALGHLYPEKTTLISQNHKVFFQGQMVKAKHLVDDCNVTNVPYNGQVLYNVLLEEHEKMQVNNLIVETLHPEHKVAKLYRFLQNVDAAHHGKLIALFNKKDKEHRNHL